MNTKIQYQASTESLSTIIAEHFYKTSYNDLPQNAVTAAKHILFDTLVVGIAGRNEAGAAEGREIILANGGIEQSRLWGSRYRVPAMSAAFVNGVAAAALDFDSVHEGGTVHSDIVVAPAVLALAEARDLSGRDVLTALALGNDLAGRLGMCRRVLPTGCLGVGGGVDHRSSWHGRRSGSPVALVREEEWPAGRICMRRAECITGRRGV